MFSLFRDVLFQLYLGDLYGPPRAVCAIGSKDCEREFYHGQHRDAIFSMVVGKRTR